MNKTMILQEYETGKGISEIASTFGVSRQRIDQIVHYDKNRCRQILHYQIEHGRITPKPCEICGNPDTQAHHDDYQKPLEVKWLCKEHHSITRIGEQRTIHKHQNPRDLSIVEKFKSGMSRKEIASEFHLSRGLYHTNY